MTTILSLPAWYDVLECEAQLAPEVRGFPGPFGGPTEVQDLLGDRWRFRHQLPDGDFRWGGRGEALFNALRGGANWLRLHHLARPVPGGNARGTMALASSMAQGANSMQISGLIAAPNLLAYCSFSMDGNSDGLSDGLASYSVGSVSGLAFSRPGGVQRVSASSLGGTSGDLAGVQFLAAIPVTAGVGYVAAVDMLSTVGTSHAIEIPCYNASNTYLGNAGFASWSGTGSFSRRAVAFTPMSGAAYCLLYLYVHSSSGGAVELKLANVQVEPGAVAGEVIGPAVLRAGDMLGHNSEQLFQVYVDATANDAGTITVTTVNRARKAIASGQAIVWDKPSVPCQLLDAGGVPTSYTRGRARGQAVQFVEAWQ